MKKTFLVLTCFLFMMFCVNPKAVDVDTDIQFLVGNETYVVNGTAMSFSQIIINNSYIVFNSTGFNVTSSNDITIYIDYIHSDILNADAGDLVLEFCMDTNGGTVMVAVDGFRNNCNYSIKMNGIEIALHTSNADGDISFMNNVWSKKVFEIYQQDPVEDNPSDDPPDDPSDGGDGGGGSPGPGPPMPYPDNPYPPTTDDIPIELIIMALAIICLVVLIILSHKKG